MEFVLKVQRKVKEQFIQDYKFLQVQHVINDIFNDIIWSWRFKGCHQRCYHDKRHSLVAWVWLVAWVGLIVRSLVHVCLGQ